MLSFSYGKLLVGIWGLVLVWISIQQRGYLQCAVTAMMMFDVFSSAHGDAIILLPLLLLSERCVLSSVSLKHSAMPFVTSALFAHCIKNARSGSWWSFAFFAQGAGLAIPYALGVHPSQGIGAVVYVATGTIAFLTLRRGKAVSEREALLIASLCGFINYDAVVNRTVDPSLRGVTSVTGFPHIAARSAFIAAQVVLFLVSIAGSKLLNRGDSAPSNGAQERTKSRADAPSGCVSTATFLICLYCGVMAGYGVCFFTFREEPLTWLVAYLISSPMRLRALILWSVGIPLATVGIHFLGKGLILIIRRKLFHLVGIVAFLPMALYDGEFLALSVSVAFSLGAIVECARLHHVRGTAALSSFMVEHVDHRESSSSTGEGAIRTHLYLILGFALSIIIYMRQQMTVGLPLAPPLLMSVFVVPGIVGLGMMDATAAVVGTMWKSRVTSRILCGSRKGNSKTPASVPASLLKVIDSEVTKGTLGPYLCPEGSRLGRLFPIALNPSMRHKTTSGTIAAVVLGETFWVGLFLVGVLGVRDYRVCIPSVVGIAVGAFAEAALDGIDNLELPMIISGLIQTTIALVSLAVTSAN